MSLLRRFDASSPAFEADFSTFLAEPRGGGAAVDAAVTRIVDSVRTEGIAAVLRFTRELDGVELGVDGLRVNVEEIAQGAAACAPELRAAIAMAAARIRAFHERLRPADGQFTDDIGARLAWRWTPIDAVGIYVPGGRAAYPSTVLMNAIPASVAGVGRIAMATPPGRLEPAVLAAVQEAGIGEIWRVGGAQAVAALAYGAGPIAPVDKIVGPGNAFVTAAKRAVFGAVGIDSLAGPSEVVIVADAANDPDWIAADMLAQAEHDPAAQAILITDNAAFADQVAMAIARQLDTLATADAAAASLRDHGAIILAGRKVAPILVDRIAPEHLELALEDPEAMAAAVRHAGAIFLGRYTPEALGDYVAGTNHVLPTSGSARFSSGLSTADFMKRTSLVDCGPGAFDALADATEILAVAEGLPAHARSVSTRRNA